MATRTAIIDGDITNADTFGGTAPVDGDTIAFDGHTLWLASDLGASPTLGIAFSGTGKFILKNGARMTYLKSSFMSAAIEIQFGEPGTPLPATGSFYGNAAAEMDGAGNYHVIGGNCPQISAYTLEREGPLCAKVVSAPDSTHTVVDGTQEFLTGDILLFQATTECREVVVTGWDTGTRTLTHAAIVAGCQVAGVNVELLSCPAVIRREGTAGLYSCVQFSGTNQGVYAPDGSLFVVNHYSANSNQQAIRGAAWLYARRIAASCNNGFTREESITDVYWLDVGTLQANYLSLESYSGGAVIGRAGIYYLYASIAYPAKVIISGGYIVTALPSIQARPSAHEQFYLWFRDVELPAVYHSGTLKGETLIRQSAMDGSTDVWETVAGFAVKTQDVPEGSDLPNAYLLTATDSVSKPFYDEFIWCKRGQTVRAILYYFVPASGAYAGLEMFDALEQIPAVSAPLASFESAAGGPFFSWQISDPITYQNNTKFDKLIRVRAYGRGAYDVYVRIKPEIGGGPA